VLATDSWEPVEHAEGRIDFTLLDARPTLARRHNHKLVLRWSGSCNNGVPSYAPQCDVAVARVICDDESTNRPFTGEPGP
jgi:hypothetical protein